LTAWAFGFTPPPHFKETPVAILFTEENKIVVASLTSAGAAGQTAITSASVDTAGFDGCCFIIPTGPIVSGAVTTAKVQHSADTSGSPDDFSDLLGSSIVIADDDDDQVKYLDVVRPQKRFLKVVVSRATQNATIGGIIAVLYRARTKPVTQPAGTEGETVISAAEGTA
jgi:hypothetical protein